MNLYSFMNHGKNTPEQKRGCSGTGSSKTGQLKTAATAPPGHSQNAGEVAPLTRSVNSSHGS